MPTPTSRRAIGLLERAADVLGATSIDAVPDRIAALQSELRETRRRLRAGSGGDGTGGGIPKPGELASRAEDVAPGIRIVAFAGPFESIEAMKGYAKELRGTFASGVIALGLDADEPQVFVSVSDDLVEQGVAAGALVQGAVPAIDGKGGGRPEMAQGRGTRREGLADALAAVRAAVAARSRE